MKPAVRTKVEIDPGEAFSLYALHGGNVERVALILGADVADVAGMASRWNWKVKVKDATGDSTDSTEAQRQLNRGVNFIQAHRLRSFVDSVIQELSDSDAMRAATTIASANGSRRDFRVLRDVAEAARTAQELTYRALGDSLDAARNERAKGSEGSIALAAMAAMDAADAAPGVSSVELVRRSLAKPA